MHIEQDTQFLNLTPEEAWAIAEGALDITPVKGLTHNFYRYPARFSPRFVRAVIKIFTKPGDVVFDPFMGGGTTLVEAMTLGRISAGCDLSSLATFVAQAKTTIYSSSEVETMRAWASKLPANINLRKISEIPSNFLERGYLRNLNNSHTWRIKKAIQQCLNYVDVLSTKKLRNFGRCMILKTAQWALDSRKQLPTVGEFRRSLLKISEEMLVGAEELRKLIDPKLRRDLTPLCFQRSAIGIEKDKRIKKIKKPKLIITSPPYPGVHVLYHRWQVDGRRETPAPFWIANKTDGAGLSYYTLGDRSEKELKSYFDNLLAAFLSIRKVCSPETILVQMVAFSDPTWQLPVYLQTMHDAGFQERNLSGLDQMKDGRLWRSVPNRRWHADLLGDTNSSREVVLLFKPVD